MKCPFCKSRDTKVTDSRDTDEGAAIRRRRQCLSCGRRFTTYETVEKLPLRVIKKNGKRELFDRSKIRNGITRACEKTNVSSAQIEEIIDLVEHTIRNDPKRELPTTEIGNIGIAICHEGVYPEVARGLAMNGAEIIIRPTR